MRLFSLLRSTARLKLRFETEIKTWLTGYCRSGWGRKIILKGYKWKEEPFAKSSCIQISLLSLSSFRNVNFLITSLCPSPRKANFHEVKRKDYLRLKVLSSETVSFFLPFFLREAKTLRPLAVAIRSRKPCLLVLFLRDGWYVRFICWNFSSRCL